MKRIGIIGSGITAAAVAYLLRRSLRETGCEATIDVFERSERIGGRIETIEADGLMLDVGAEAMAGGVGFHTQLIQSLDLSLIRPAHLPLGVFENNHLRMIGSDALSVSSKASASALGQSGTAQIKSQQLKSEGSKQGDIFSADSLPLSQVLEARWGADHAASVWGPIFETIYGGSAHELSGALGLRAGTRGGVAGTISVAGGMIGLVQRLFDSADVRFHLGHAVTSIEARVIESSNAEGWNIDGHQFDLVVLCVPPASLIQLLPHIAPRTIDQLGNIGSRALRSFTVEVFTSNQHADAPRSAQSLLPRCSGVLLPLHRGVPHRAQHPALRAVTFLSNKWPDSFHGRALVRGIFTEHNSLPDESVSAQEAVTQITELLNALTGASLSCRLIAERGWSPGAFHPRIGFFAQSAQIENELGLIPRLYIPRASYAGLGIADCLSSANETVRKILEISLSDAGAQSEKQFENKTLVKHQQEQPL